MCVVCVCVHMQKSKWALHLVTLVLKDKMGGWGTEWHQNINSESRARHRVASQYQKSGGHSRQVLLRRCTGSTGRRDDSGTSSSSYDKDLAGQYSHTPKLIQQHCRMFPALSLQYINNIHMRGSIAVIAYPHPVTQCDTTWVDCQHS